MSNHQDLRRLPASANSLESIERKPCERISRSTPAGWRFALWVTASAMLLAGSARLMAKEQPLNELGRILLIRGLDREIAVAKVVLPRGKRGLFVNGEGQIDQERARKEIMANGAALQPGIPVEITSIKFKDHAIVFEINNGGKSHKKWYQHIQIGMGGVMQPLDSQAQQNPIAYGSSITLD
ncbi:MAG TPA: hypothetical protein VNG91_03630, partial [Terriglobia bacterium]|nr:hypothetical protein [Terriglobia bacterium]